MNLNSYLAPVLKWWWLILIAAAIAGGATFVATLGQPPVYQARTTLLIGHSINSPNPSSSQFYLEQELAKIYADMGVREPVRRATMEALGMDWLPAYSVRALPNTQLLEITVNDTDPVRAQIVAAELANQLVSRTPTSARPEDQERQAFIDEQLSILQEDIQTTQDELQQLKVQLGDLRGAQEIASTERQIAALENKLTTLQENFASLISKTQQGASNTLTIIEPAEVPSRPIGPNQLFSIVLAAALGASLAVGGAYLIEFLDETVKSSEEVTRLLEWPALAEMIKMPDGANPATYVQDQPFSVVADIYRTLRANLELAGLGQTIRTMLVTSPAVSDGKSTTALNLALTLAKTERRVALIDADFYRSTLNLGGQKGLGDLLLDGVHPREYLISPYPNSRLLVLPAGVNILNATEMLSSPHMSAILNDLKEVADIVVVDGPPFIVSDAVVLASKVDGILIVARPGQSRREALLHLKAQLRRTSANVLGVVINGVSAKVAQYNQYYSQFAITGPRPNGRALKPLPQSEETREPTA